METMPFLLRIYEAQGVLGVSRDQLKKLYPHVHSLRLPYNSRRLPYPYLRPLRPLLDHRSDARYTPIARTFAQTPEAEAAIRTVEATFEEMLTNTVQMIPRDGEEVPAFTAGQVVKLLNLGRMTLTEWYQKDQLETFVSNHVLCISEVALREVIDWQRPIGQEQMVQ